MARREPEGPSLAAWRRIEPARDRDIYHHASPALGDTPAAFSVGSVSRRHAVKAIVCAARLAANRNRSQPFAS